MAPRPWSVGALLSLFVILLSLITNRVFSQDTTIDDKTRLKNFIKISQKTWPPKDSVQSNEDHFFFFHNEYDPTNVESSQRTFKPDILKDRELVNNFDFYFKHWTDSSFAILNPISEHKNDESSIKKLFKAENWTPQKVTNINSNIWNNMKLKVVDVETSTLALKDISLQFIEKIRRDNGREKPISDPDSSSKNSKFEQINLPNSLQVLPKNGKFNLKTSLPSDQFELSFQLKAILGKTDFEKKITLNGSPSKCLVAGENAGVSCTLTKKEKVISLSVQVDLKTVDNSAFIIYDAKLKDSNDVTFTLEDPSDEGEIYVVNSTKADISYTTLFDQQPLDQSQCYHILRPKNLPNSIGVYFKLEPNALLEQKLFESSEDDIFCLDHFIALRNLANYTLTLAIEGPIKEEISFGVKREKKAVSETFQLKNIEQSNSEKSVKANQWFITPQQKNFDFKFSFNHSSDVQVFACDILANCFEYEVVSKHYTLAKQYQDALRPSPYFRIQRNDKKSLENVAFTYQAAKDALEQINKDLSKSMKNITTQDITDGKKYTFALESGERQSISLPLNDIDLRLNHLEVKLEAKGSASTVPVSVNNIEYQDPQSIQNLNSFFLLRTNAQTNGIILDISTEELFYVESTQTERIGGSLNIELLAEENSNKTGQQIELTLSVNNVDTAQPDQSNKISQKYSIFPQPKESSAILNKDNPRMLISSDLLRSPASRRLLTHNASIAFQMTDLRAPNRTYSLDLLDVITIKRLVMSGGSIAIEQMVNVTRNEPSDPKSIVQSYQFEDNYDGEEVQGGAFVLAYLLEFDSRDETILSVEVRVSDFEIAMPKRQTRNDFDKQAGTVVAGSEPDYDPPNCPLPLLECGESFDAHDFAYLYKRQAVRCELPACDNIFTSPLLSSKIYYEDQSEKRNQFLPFKMSRQSSSFIELKRTKFDIEEPEPISAEFDFCVKFKYHAKNQPLLVAVNELDKGYQISFPVIDKLSGENRVCASWLRPDVRTVDRLLFAFAEEVTSVDEHYVQITEIDSIIDKLGPEQSCLKEGIQHDKLFDLASAFLQYPKAISFEDKSIILKNRYSPGSGKEAYFLRTKWIPSIKTAEDTVRVGLQALSGNITSSFLRATFTISSPEENNIYIATDLSNLKTSSSEVNVLQLKKKVDYFQLNFRFEVDYSVMEEHEKPFNVNLTQLVINDACAPQEPNAAKCENGGKCLQKYSNYSTTCECKTNWYGKLCEFEDFCQTKNGISKCLGKKCENNNEWQTYMCKCEQDQRYDMLNQRCVPNEIDCPPNFVYNVRSSKCDNCAYGFVKNRLQNGTALCEPFDLCNEKHRITRYMSRVPCHDRLAQCRVVSNAQDSNEDPHECICPAEKSLYNQYGRRDASATCARKECELCAQECVNKNDGWSCTCNDAYDLAPDGHNCVPKNGTRPCELRADSPPDMPKPFVNHEDVCVCPTDFIYRNQSCEFEQYKWISRFRCPTNTGVEMNAQDHLPGCVCKSGQRFNPITRGCDEKCDQTNEVNCATARDAHGCEFKNGSPTCVCDSGSFPFAESEDKLDQWKCKPLCELLQEQAENRTQCNPYDFEYCDSTKIGIPEQNFDGLIEHKLNQVFVQGNSSVKINHNDYCKCETNFVRDDDKCIPKGLPIRYIQEITFNANPAMKDIAYSSKVKEVLMKLVSKLLGVKSDDIIKMETGCERSSPNEFKCHTAFVSGLNESVVKSRLIDSCIPIDSTSCVYLIESGLAENLANLPLRLLTFAAPPSPTVALGDTGLLLRQIDAPIKTSTMRYCEKSTRCARYQYTKCENVEKEYGYNCVCDQPQGVDDLFEAEDKQYLDTVNNKYKMEQCVVKPLCDAHYCKDTKAECQEFVEHNSTGIWVHHRICQCPDSDKPLRNPTDLCDQSPKPSNECAKLTKPCSGHGHCVDAPNEPKKFVCTCTAGWSGEICNVEVSNDIKKESDDDDVPKGYMIATIILAIVAALAIVALAIFYFRSTSRKLRIH